MGAILVLRNGRITYERCKTMTPETTHNWFSSGRVISATLLSMLEHQSKADLPKPVSCYLLQLKQYVTPGKEPGATSWPMAASVHVAHCHILHCDFEVGGWAAGWVALPLLIK
jgi:hypothetical protein